ncbi:LysR family transcriptional regulator [Cereibacter changlensis JA139]|uniref:HTH-type transcriptional regulator CbbR n=2 Tax=Cereibacter changlensis TaxID=402884 RepID=A0A2T4JT07_9RHOB|nr:LysR family transcriptional regulator [Cereibacter changlensis]PTE20903.1 LysR family transcriptional regulator [Cereibacter changlensis JA139]PZX58897.1 molybdate transport repressor ModE-like protein [Cereibacter changlensis]
MIRLDALTLKQLRALAAVAERGSLTAAAEKIGLTPPAIHNQIKNLEEVFALPLLNRGADSTAFSLTPAGEAVLEAAQRIDVILSQASYQVMAVSEGRSGQVTLGVVSTGRYFAPLLVHRLQELCPEIRVALRVRNREQIVEDLQRHVVDLAIMGRPPRVPEVASVALGPHPHGLVARPDHPLAGREAPAPELLAQTFLAREEGSGTRLLMSRYLDRLGDGQVIDIVEMDSNETIKQAVIAGLGIAFLSLHTVMDELRFGQLVQLSAAGLPIERHWFLVHPVDARLRPAALRLQEAIIGLKGSYLPNTRPAVQTPT